MKNFLLSLLSILLIFYFSELNAVSGLRPKNVSWVEIDRQNFQFIGYFEKVTIITYFQATRSEKKIFPKYVPLKQEFIYHPTGQVFTNTRMINRIWDDGASGYQFNYDNINLITEENKKFNAIMTTIDEFGMKLNVRYTLYKL